MEVSREAVDALTSQVNAASDAVLRVVRARLPAIEGESRRPDGSIDVATFRHAVLAEVEPVLASATDASAAAAAQLYDLIRSEVLGEPFGASPESGRDPAATEEAVRYFAQSVVDSGETGEFSRKLDERIDYEVKRAAGHSTMANARRDPARPRWARVPSGRETCGFCIMLASRGFVYDELSKDFHTHPGCDCRIVPRFSNGQTVAGYDPDGMRERWDRCAATVDEKSVRRSAEATWAAMDYSGRARWGADGKALDRYAARALRNAQVSECETRDPGWLRSGREPDIGFASQALRAEVESERPWELAAARSLSRHGIRCDFVVDREEYVDPRDGQLKFVGLPDLAGGIELKSLLKAKGVGAVDRALRDAGHKKGLRTCVIDNTENVLADKDVMAAVSEKMAKRGVVDCLVLLGDGRMKRLKA